MGQQSKQLMAVDHRVGETTGLQWETFGIYLSRNLLYSSEE